jgi:phosphoserine phosphatase
MTRRLVVLDVDSTLIENEVIELLADVAGSRERVAAITERAMRGELDFAESLRERVSTLAGVPESAFELVRSQVSVTSGVPELISAVHETGGKVGVVSGGFHEILDPIAEDLGIDFWKANRLEVIDGHLSGRVAGPIIDAQAKADALEAWATAESINLEHTVAIGDGANDLKMMAVAGISIAFDAKPIVAAEADYAITSRDMREAIRIIGL